MKKVLILFCLLFFLTGCSVQYDLDFSDDIFKESIKIGKFDKDKIVGFDLYEPISYYDSNTSDYYNLNYSKGYLNLDYDYSISKFRVSSTLTECYDFSGITTDDKYFYILTSDEFKCLSYDGYVANNVKINFTTDYEVVETNADSVDGNVYTWIINKDNSNSKPISIKLKNKSDDSSSTEKTNKNSFNLFNYLIFITIFFVIILLVFIFLKIKNEKANSLD